MEVEMEAEMEMRLVVTITDWSFMTGSGVLKLSKIIVLIQEATGEHLPDSTFGIMPYISLCIDLFFKKLWQEGERTVFSVSMSGTKIICSSQCPLYG